ncbi:LOW QUALITY PROTEIN: rho family-interacting cell polarization regulator 1-like [Gadus macrocephalus]|uniref:LOW QUALITY PROTEIN: rho family-interacting cell polarization regulator 1-like n=1 Tax=Gadus macrocephalus TaxID=80720 RepID=UPI0028CB910F|nr:LOW QUALITY PROTEIN: rho family-interacting cell polarization regulator 1-like [Gadus macrocephalus]
MFLFPVLQDPGSPSRAVSTMSLSARPSRRVLNRSITRSQSFAGVNTYDKAYRNLSVFTAPGLSRKTSRASRMFNMTTKSNTPPKVPQPERLDEVYEALKKGLQSYLQVHQVELDSLSRQMKESKRNSRLGFLYELDKQVKVNERFIRRLEFHLSKIEELYEAYCRQRRLRDGAEKMVKAYTASSSSKEARESLSEANKSYKEYTENMCVLESELESLLGEFHIRMKGLAGFARLCAGDQYEVLMRYGRQRWKLRGRIEINGKQDWDSEEMVFLPLVTEFLSIKVTELKSLANHVVVGTVSCETKDLYAALPQTVAVDINDLGTIKLSLEVTWNPFDKDDLSSAASTVNKAPSVNKRFSTIFNQSPPDTPSLREQAFYNMLRRQDDLENGTAWSNSSESSDDSSSPRLSAGGLRHSSPDKPAVSTPDRQPAATGSSSPQIDITFCPKSAASSTPNSAHKGVGGTADGEAELQRDDQSGTAVLPANGGGDEDSGKPSPAATKASAAAAAAAGGGGGGLRRHAEALHALAEPHQRDSADGSLGAEVTPLASPLSITDITMELPDPAAELQGGGGPLTHTALQPEAPPPPGGQGGPPPTQDGTFLAHRVMVDPEERPGGGARAGQGEEGEEGGLVDSGVEEALEAVVSSLDDYRGQFPELQLLEQELRLLQLTLKGGKHSRSPSIVSLTVETALGSFDFLNGSDADEEEDGAGRKSRNGSAQHERDWMASPAFLTTGCAALDRTLVVHLNNCSSQLLRLGMFGPLRCGEMYALDRLLLEARILEMVRRAAKESPGALSRPEEVIPQLEHCQGALLVWQQCVGRGHLYHVTTESLLTALGLLCSFKLPEKMADAADLVFQRLVERILERRLPRRSTDKDVVLVTIFQLWSYLEVEGIKDLNAHVSELAEEVRLVQSLSSGDQEVLVRALRRPPDCSLKREGLHAVARLLRDHRGKVSASASSLFRSLAEQPRSRERALVICLELLEDTDVETRVCGCKALACLKAKEGIEQLVYLCRTDKEEVRDAAKQALLVLGEEGRMAFRHVETSQEGLPSLFTPGGMASTAF